MKRIIVNGKFLSQKTTGVQRYAREILSELDKLISKDEIVLAIPNNCENIPEYKNIKIQQVGKLKGVLWEQISFPLYVKSQKAIPLNLCNASPLISPGIVYIHDVKIKTHPEYFGKGFLLWYKLLFKNDRDNAKKIITVSDFSKKEISKYYKIDENKICVISPGWQHLERTKFDNDALKKYKLKKGEYFFAMGSMEPNKNFRWVAEVAKNNPKYTFAIAGSINSKVFAAGLGFECPNNMKLLGFVSDEEAKTLMRDCKAFLFPSIYEGFGLPPLEAISSGCNSIVASDIAVIHENFGDTVNYVNPNDFDIDLENLRPSDFKEILNKFSWEKSAKQLLNLLYSIDL